MLERNVYCFSFCGESINSALDRMHLFKTLNAMPLDELWLKTNGDY